MYGYVRPFKPEMKIKEYERYKAIYCGLCHTLRKKYGFLARFAVSYDMTLPALLLTGDNAKQLLKRCPFNPFKKKCVICDDAALEQIAALTIILAYHKTLDTIADGGFLKKIAGFFPKVYLKRKYKRARAAMPDFDKLAADNLAVLYKTERAPRSENTDEILDMCADYFAKITAGFSELWHDITQRRIYRELFYHIGRAVYILDAVDDYEKDIQENNFNPIEQKYGVSDKSLPQHIKSEVCETIEVSLASAAAAFELLDTNIYTSIVENIIYFGMRNVLDEVMSATRQKKRHQEK